MSSAHRVAQRPTLSATITYRWLTRGFRSAEPHRPRPPASNQSAAEMVDNSLIISKPPYRGLFLDPSCHNPQVILQPPRKGAEGAATFHHLAQCFDDPQRAQTKLRGLGHRRRQKKLVGAEEQLDDPEGPEYRDGRGSLLSSDHVAGVHRSNKLTPRYCTLLPLPLLPLPLSWIKSTKHQKLSHVQR